MGLSVLVFVVILTFYAARWLSGVNRKLIEECQRDGLPHPRNLPSSVRLGIGQKLAALMLATGLPFTAWLMWILARDPDLEYVPPLVIGAVLLATITLGAILVNTVKNRLFRSAGARYKQESTLGEVADVVGNRKYIPAGLLLMGIVICGLMGVTLYSQIARPMSLTEPPATLEAEAAIPGAAHVALSAPINQAASIPPGPLNVQVYFVPIGNLDFVDVPYLVGYYKQKFGLTITPLPWIVPGRTFNPRRRQYQAEGLIRTLQTGYQDIANDGRSILIGITEGDIYTASENWRFALGLRAEGRLAVVSTARMDLDHVNYGTPVDFVGLHSRLTKMISRELGFLYYGLPISRNQRSVMRSSIMGVDELDDLGEDF